MSQWVTLQAYMGTTLIVLTFLHKSIIYEGKQEVERETGWDVRLGWGFRMELKEAEIKVYDQDILYTYMTFFKGLCFPEVPFKNYLQRELTY